MVSFFGTVWPSKDRKKVQNWPFSPTHCFYVFPGICRRFWPEVLTQTPKNAVFRPRSYSKGPNHALEKVLTKETPGILNFFALSSGSPGRTQSNIIFSQLIFHQERLVELFVPGLLGDLVHQIFILCESEENDS